MLQVRDVSTSGASGACSLPPSVQTVVSDFRKLVEPKQRYQLLLEYARRLPAFPEELKRPETRVMGCTAQVGSSMQPHQHISSTSAVPWQ